MTAPDAAATATPVDGLVRVERALATRYPTEDRIAPDLDRIRDVLELLGTPQRAFPSIHITGTNGKTSTTRMVDALLRAFGLRPGRYTSPHLQSVTERIAIDGAPLRPEAFATAYDEVAPYVSLVDARHPQRMTFFEVLTAMAFSAFADAPVDVGVIEVGLGGRWDATNVLDAPVAVVTSVGLDHQVYLGETVSDIAAEKAGIVHAGATLVAAAQPHAEATAVLRARVDEVGARMVTGGVDFGVADRAVAFGGQLLSLQGLGGRYDEIYLPLFGAHQADNAGCALAAVEAFLGGGEQPLDIEAVREGFAAVQSPGRLEVVRTSPSIVLDGAHNPAGMAALVAALAESFHFDRLVAVIAVLADKDAAAMLGLLASAVDAVVVTTNVSPRALPADTLAAVARDVLGDDRVEVAANLPDAIDAAVALVEDEHGGGGGGVLVTGSLYTVGEARTLLVR
ncbi:MAG: folylpolyglutamate synthase/dihydrofolate synthase family protein [Mycobacteriales bacterium]